MTPDLARVAPRRRMPAAGVALAPTAPRHSARQPFFTALRAARDRRAPGGARILPSENVD